MKKVFLFAAMMLFAASTVTAQPGGFGGNFDPEQMTKMMVDRLKTELSLNDDQAKKVSAVYTEQNKKMMEQMQGGMNGDMDQMRAQMEKNRKETETKMKEILTEDQFKKWSESQRSFGQGGPQGGGPR